MAYLTQYEKVKRLFGRINHQGNGSASYLDDLRSFFENCYHLKDWIKNDDNVNNSIKRKVEKYIENNIYLSICGDVANKSKHYKLKEHIRVDGELKAGVTIFVGEGKSVGKYTIETNTGKNFDAVNVANEAMKAWEDFLIKNGLNNN